MTIDEPNCGNCRELDHKNNAKFVVDLFHRMVVHHGLWFAEAVHQFGRERALEILGDCFERSFDIQMKHIGRIFDFTVEDGVPSFLLQMEEAKLVKLREQLAKNWLVNDGVWFQSIEFSQGMNDAKRCNDSCWGLFSPVEASSIKRMLGLGKHPGLQGLKQALGFRIYANINEQSVTEETDTSFVFQMNRCRVQDARKRKGLDDYPCKSAGLVEYAAFARSIDSRIKTECVGCPPDAHPEEWYCAWRFSLEAGQGNAD